MLKPKRKISKQEIKIDPFLEFINNGQQWLKDKKKIIYQVVFGVIAVIAIIYFINNNKTNSATEAEALLGKAILAQDLNDMENAKFQLQTLINDYEGTKYGNEGNYYLGKIYYNSGGLVTAESFLDKYVKSGDNYLLMTTAYKLLSEIAISNDNKDTAEDYLRKGTKYAEGTVYHDEMSLLLANQLLINGNNNKARKIVDNILERENSSILIKKNAEELKGRLEY